MRLQSSRPGVLIGRETPKISLSTRARKKGHGCQGFRSFMPGTWDKEQTDSSVHKIYLLFQLLNVLYTTQEKNKLIYLLKRLSFLLLFSFLMFLVCFFLVLFLYILKLFLQNSFLNELSHSLLSELSNSPSVHSVRGLQLCLVKKQNGCAYFTLEPGARLLITNIYRVDFM